MNRAVYGSAEIGKQLEEAANSILYLNPGCAVQYRRTHATGEPTSFFIIGKGGKKLAFLCPHYGGEITWMASGPFFPEKKTRRTWIGFHTSRWLERKSLDSLVSEALLYIREETDAERLERDVMEARIRLQSGLGASPYGATWNDYQLVLSMVESESVDPLLMETDQNVAWQKLVSDAQTAFNTMLSRALVNDLIETSLRVSVQLLEEQE